MTECTGQIESVDIWLLLYIVHDVSVSVPGIHQAKVGDGCRNPVQGEDIIVFELLHQHYFLAKPLYHLSDKRQKASLRGIAWHTYTLGSLYVGIIMRHSENLERHHLIIIPAPPDFG